MIEVIGALRSRAFRVLWALEELGVEYKHTSAGPRSAEARALNPSGKIPILKDGDAILTDSFAILTYLADKYGGLTHPAGTVERAHQDAASLALLDELEGPLWTFSKHSFVLPEDLRVANVRPAVEWEIARAQKHFARRLGDGPYVMGEKFTVPDILAGHMGNWAAKAGLGSDDPAWAAYFERLRARPAFQRVDTLDR